VLEFCEEFAFVEDGLDAFLGDDPASAHGYTVLDISFMA
jgi:hypothetical protein